MSVRIIPQDVAQELVYAGVNAFVEDYQIIENELVGQARWDTIHRLTVCAYTEGYTYWQTFYRQGATENQYYPPFEYDSEVEFVQVYPKEISITVYEKKEKASEKA